MSRWSLGSCFLAACFAVGAVSQELPRRERWQDDPRAQPCWVQPPIGFSPTTFVPVVVVLADTKDEPAAEAVLASHGEVLARAGFVVAVPVGTESSKPGPGTEPLPSTLMFHSLRARCRVEQGGLHAVVMGGEQRDIQFVLAQRVEFQTVTECGDADKAEVAVLRRLPARRVRALPDSDPARLAKHLQKLHAERTLPGAAGEVAKVLDDFHDAAAVGDEKRYFAILPDDALFLGTDGTERWTGAEFKKFAMPYFQRDSAWTYVCLRRHVDVDAGGQFAWFDEAFDNEAYGECRGSGVMQKRDGAWVLRQYHLTVPVPNDVTRSVAARIRAFQDQVPLPKTTIVFVRHAEKVDDSADAGLSDGGKARAERLATVLSDLPIAAVYVSNRQRTAQTVAPVCRARSLQAVEAERRADWAPGLVAGHRGQTVLVCGHSNTVPAMLKQLGITTPVTIADDEYDRLFVVTLRGDDPPQMVALRY